MKIKDHLYFYLVWCKDHDKKPQDYKNLTEYLREIERIQLYV